MPIATLAQRLRTWQVPRAAHRARQRRLGRALAREAAAALLGHDARELAVGGGRDSRPILFSSGRPLQEAALAISHSGAWACAAATHAPHGIGIDVQELRTRPTGPLARHMGWLDWLAGTGEDELRSRFTQAWTLWEATAKCDGAGAFGAATPAFAALAGGLVPGRESEWLAEPYWACTRRIDATHWLTLVARVGGPLSPSVAELHRG